MRILYCTPKANKPYFGIDVGMAEVLKLLEFAVDLLNCASVTIDAQCGAASTPISIIDRRFVIVSIPSF